MGAAATAASAALNSRSTRKYEPSKEPKSAPSAPQRFSSRAGLTPEEKDALDAAEEPMTRRYSDMSWNCHQCGIALLDVWGETLCHACHKRADPFWRTGKAFTKPVVVYAKVPKQSPSEQERRRSSIGQHSTDLDIMVTETEGGNNRRSSSKGGVALEDARSRSASKTSVAIQDNASRSSSKQAGSQAGDSDHASRQPSHSVVPEAVSRASSKHDHRHTKAGMIAPEPTAAEERPASRQQTPAPPPPFSDIEGTIDLLHKLGEDKDGHHHHHHHHHHHKKHDHAADRKTQRQSQEESVEQLAQLKDERGHGLSMGDRVIGEGKIGEEMGMGTVTGANTSHGHGMVVVQYDSGHSHPMKAEHLRVVDSREEADVVRRAAQGKKNKKKGAF